MYKKTRYLPWILAALICFTIAVSWQWERTLEQPVLGNLGTPATVTGDRPIEPIPNPPELNTEKVKEIF